MSKVKRQKSRDIETISNYKQLKIK